MSQCKDAHAEQKTPPQTAPFCSSRQFYKYLSDWGRSDDRGRAKRVAYSRRAGEKDGNTSKSPDKCESSSKQNAPQKQGDQGKSCDRETQED
ncbi:hypothetical protein KSF_043090 [Reticulibacter mediterranei]|uniref:Uncharacterized protein n=1 Tax=Reticulibacter mediterranei TaxID=2778369 RepID=A0A8J3IQ34_9CHLR|nr:hypothetical protein KSF_043090 [Reticulibacter mediterranei]